MVLSGEVGGRRGFMGRNAMARRLNYGWWAWSTVWFMQ